MGLKSIPEDASTMGDIAPDTFQKKPLYVWLRSFAGRELDEDDSFANFVASNALTYALEYIGIASENEQSSLHLSAIFDEDSHHQSRSNKYPSHFESETKSRIQQLNRVFVELISYYDYHHGQIVAIKPPNTVHISSSCHLCGVREFEKFLFLIMGAAIQGTQKQETIKKIKRFPQEIQESLINCIKLIADSPELINIKSWQEFHSLDEDEQKKTYENLLSVIRRLLIERNESIQNQLLSDYYAGFMNCSQRRIYESKGYGSYSDAEKYSDDSRMSAAIRQLREELQVKTELLQECREELEITKYQVRELETELTETQIKLRAYKKARDELDVLREGQEKNSRLESELHRLKTKLEEAEHVYERVEVLEVENRKLQLQHDVLVDQISFLSLDRPSLDGSSNVGLVPNLSVDLDRTLTRDEDKFFESDDEVPSVAEKINPVSESVVKEEESRNEEVNDKKSDPGEDAALCDSQIEEAVVEHDFNEQLQRNEDEAEIGPLTSTPVAKKQVEQKSQEVQTPPFQMNTKRKKRSTVSSTKRCKKPIILLPGQRFVPMISESVIGDNSKGLEESNGPAIKVFKIYNVSKYSARRRSSGKPKKFKTPNGRELNEKQVVPNLDVGNEADEELSISPNGPRNDSDLDSNNDMNGQTEKQTINNEEIYFSPDPGVTHPENSPDNTVSREVPSPHSFVTNYESTTTTFPVSKGVPCNNTHTVHHVTFSPNEITLGSDQSGGESHSNHLSIYNRNLNNNNNTISKELPASVQLPLLRISNGINISLQHSDTEEEEGEVGKRLRSAFNVQLQQQHHHSSTSPVPMQSAQGTSTSGISAPFNNNNNNDNEFTFSDCNIQVNLRNSSVKPATAYINKISTLTSSSSFGESGGAPGVVNGGILRNSTSAMNSTHPQYYHTYHPQQHESSSEDDESVWYEYGCV